MTEHKEDDHLVGEIYLNGELYVWRLVNKTSLVTVFAPDNRHKTTQLGDSPPEAIARLLAGELSREKAAN
jgi:hypothetical protein